MDYALKELCNFYLDKFGVERKIDMAVIEKKFFDKVMDKVCEGERMPLPLNLGYIQGLEYKRNPQNLCYAQIQQRVADALKTFGAYNYKVIWAKHPMYRYHTMAPKFVSGRKLKAAKLNGAVIPNTCVHGDFFLKQWD
jgi:hypothetical protein